MNNTDIYSKIISEYIAEMEYPALPKLLYDPIRYTMDDRGKRLRPMFVLMACGLWHDDATKALHAAAAIEMFHNFTLLHDDIMDNAPLRRGRASVHQKWNSNVAILSGDALMIYAWRELARTAPESLAAVLEYFNEATVKVCEGQQYDMDFEERENVRLPEHTAMIELKTASLFVGAVSMGAIIGGSASRMGGSANASSDDIENLRHFALEFGVAFQMQDDLLDSFGDARLGKTVGGDILEGKKTFLKMTAMAAATPDDRAQLAMIHKDLRYSPEEKIARVLELYNKYEVREATEAEISRRFALAADFLDRLSAAPERVEEFKAFALSQLGRSK